MKAEFEKLPTVRKVEDLASHLPATPPEQTKLLIQAIHAEVAQLTPVKFEPRVVNLGYAAERAEGSTFDIFLGTTKQNSGANTALSGGGGPAQTGLAAKQTAA